MARVWIDEAVCAGCGACVGVCPTGAISLIAGKARVDAERCQGCEACIEACPAGAIRPVLDVDIVPEPASAPVVWRPAPVTARRPAPLAQTAAGLAVAAGTGLVLRAAQAAAQIAVNAIGRWLQNPGPLTLRSTTPGERLVTGRGGGRQARHRQRGRW